MGQAFEENRKFIYSKDFIKKAKDKIKEFSTLNSILNFENANKDNYNKNYFLRIGRNAVSNPFRDNRPDSESERKLKIYDLLLKEIIPKLDGKSKAKLISRLNSYGENHFKTILELEFYIELIKNEKIKDIEYENPQKGNHDFSFKVDYTEFNLELTSLGKGIIQEILEEAYTKAANEILKNLKEETLVKLDVNSDMLLKEQGENNSNEIRDIILANYKKIENVVYCIRNNYCILEKNLGSNDEPLYELKDLYEHYSKFGERLAELLKTPEGVDYLKRTKIKDIHENPFSSFIVGDSKSRIVEIHSKSQWPSKAETLRKKSILKQLTNRVREKIKGEQLKGKSNPLIAINFQDFVMHDYTLDEDLFGRQNFEELKSIVTKVFAATKNEEILGVIFFENSLDKSKFVENPNIKIDKERLKKIYILLNRNGN